MNRDLKLDVGSHIETIGPRHRLVLLGASNLTRAFPTVVSAARTTWEGPISILAAMGFGRSYGKESRFLEKKISGIFQCGIWEALQQQKNISTTAFVTDIGNDLAYEVPVERVVKWVDVCLDRLQSLGARVVLSDLPVEVFRTMGTTRYRFLRALLFPQCRLDWLEMLARVEQLSERLHELAETRKTPIFTVESEWYRWDPIHPRRAAMPLFWRGMFGEVETVSSERSASKKSLALAWYLRGLRPEKWSSFSFSRSAKQPHGRLIDGTEVALY